MSLRQFHVRILRRGVLGPQTRAMGCVTESAASVASPPRWATQRAGRFQAVYVGHGGPTLRAVPRARVVKQPPEVSRTRAMRDTRCDCAARARSLMIAASRRVHLMDIASLLRFAVEHGASDVHIQSAAAPMLRLAGQMRAVEGSPLSRDDVLALLGTLAPPDRQGDLSRAAMEGLDFAYELPGVARFRCSAFRPSGSSASRCGSFARRCPPSKSCTCPRSCTTSPCRAAA